MLMATSKSVYALSSVHFAVSGLIPELQSHPFQLLMLRVHDMFMPFSCEFKSSIKCPQCTVDAIVTIEQKPKTEKITIHDCL